MTKVCGIVFECPNGTRHIYNRKHKKLFPIGQTDLSECQFKNYTGANQAFLRLWKESFYILHAADWHFEYGDLYV